MCRTDITDLHIALIREDLSIYLSVCFALHCVEDLFFKVWYIHVLLNMVIGH